MIATRNYRSYPRDTVPDADRHFDRLGQSSGFGRDRISMLGGWVGWYSDRLQLDLVCR